MSKDRLLSDEEQTLRVATYLSFYVEAHKAKSVEEMSKWLYKIIDMVRKSYDDGFMKASKGAFKSQQAAKREAVEEVLDRLESMAAYDPSGSSPVINPRQIEAERNKLKEEL